MSVCVCACLEKGRLRPDRQVWLGLDRRACPRHALPLSLLLSDCSRLLITPLIYVFYRVCVRVLVLNLQGNVYYPLATQGLGPDRYNPIEQIIIATPVAGGNYTITVRGDTRKDTCMKADSVLEAEGACIRRWPSTACTCAHTQSHTNTHKHSHMRTHTRTHTHSHSHTDTDTHTLTHILTHTQVNAHSLVTPQNYALVISGQFSGFNYNETTADITDPTGL